MRTNKINDVGILKDQLVRAELEKDYLIEVLRLEKNNELVKKKFRNACEKIQILKVKIHFLGA